MHLVLNKRKLYNKKTLILPHVGAILPHKPYLSTSINLGPTYYMVGNKPYLVPRGLLNKEGPTGSNSRR